MELISKGCSVKKFILILFVITSIPILAFAEDFKEVRKGVVDGVWKKIGFLYIDPSILLNNVGFNSNIYHFDKKATPDWTADAGLAINFSALVGKRFVIVVKESPYYSFFLKNKDLQFFNNKFSATIYTYLGRFNLMYNYSVNNILSRPTVEFGKRVKTKKYNSKITLDYGNYNRFFMKISVGKTNIDYDDSKYLGQYNVSSNLNMVRSVVSLTLNKVIFTRTLLFFRLEYFDLKFDSDTKKDGTGGIFSAGIKFPEVSILKGQFRIGLKYFTSENPMVEKYLKPNGSGNISIKLARRFKLHLSYVIDNRYSFYVPNHYFDIKSYTVGLDYYLGKGMKAGYDFSIGSIIYKEITGGKTGREDKTEISNFKFGIRISGNMELGIKYTNYFGKSSSKEFSRRFHFIGGYINHEF